jgi:hypothetical protein
MRRFGNTGQENQICLSNFALQGKIILLAMKIIGSTGAPAQLLSGWKLFKAGNGEKFTLLTTKIYYKIGKSK